MDLIEERMQQLIDRDLPYFLLLCGEQDRTFIVTPPAKPKREEYVRLLYIALAFRLRGAFFCILGEAEHAGLAKTVIDLFAKTGTDLQKIERWILAFIEKIQPTSVRELSASFWQETKAALLKGGYSPKHWFMA